ncbi:MAG: hypothetical protein JW801_03195 [Bacteroidales bacterium]|nr:hypothetical protein [Bacteroidales bacterium]
MKARTYTIFTFALFAFGMIISCNEPEDYSDIVYKNYLAYEIDQAITFLTTTSEGTAEGTYKTGSKQAYIDVIEASSVVNADEDATQVEIDEAYSALLQASLDFYNRMNPFISQTLVILNYARYIYTNTEEGTLEGNVAAGSLAGLKEAIDSANQTLSRTDVNQTMLDKVNADLYSALETFNSGIIGKSIINITNSGFELPGYETDDFAEVPGWGLYGVIESWMFSAATARNDSAPEGDYIARFGTYTTGIYQQLPELVQTNSTYNLSVDVALLSNNIDWQGDKYPAVLLSRFIVFEGGAGNYTFATVLSEQYDTLGLDPTAFQSLSHTFRVDNNAAYVGKKISVDFILRHTWDTQNPIYAESYVGIDNLKLTRE